MNHDIMFMSDGPVRLQDGGTWGGTEATLSLVSNWLADNGVSVGIVASGKNAGKNEHGVEFLPLDRWLQECKLKIFMRRTLISPLERDNCEQAYAWLHDFPQDPYTVKAYAPRLCVSNFLLNHIQQNEKESKDKVFWNPVNPEIKQFKKDKREDYLVWTSAYQKGIGEAIGMYKQLYDMGMTRPLKICVPEWSNRPFPFPEELKNYPIEFVGALPWRDCMELLSKSAGMFRPGFFPETFGLVYAEANYLGVPVITFDVGAAREVLTENNLIIGENTDIGDIKKYIDDIENKSVACNEDYTIQRIGKKWLKLIEKYK